MSILEEIKNNNLVEFRVKNKMLLEKNQVDILNKLQEEFNLSNEEIIVYALKKLNLERLYKSIKKEKKVEETNDLGEDNQNNIGSFNG